jgi:hypothetical protein
LRSLTQHLSKTRNKPSDNTHSKDMEIQKPCRFPVGQFVNYPNEKSEVGKEGDIEVLIDFIPSEDTIKNKSKVDILGKIVIVCQVISAVMEVSFVSTIIRPWLSVNTGF